MTRPPSTSRASVRGSAHPALVAAAIAALLAGCSAGSAPASAPAPSAIVASATHESIRLTLTLEGAPRSGAASWASVRIENVGDRAIRWAGGGCGDPGSIDVDLGTVFPAGRPDWPERLGRFKREALGTGGGDGLLRIVYTAEARWGTATACPADLRIETLVAGTHLDLRAGWDGTYEGSPVPTGPAAVTATFPLVDVQDGPIDSSSDTHAVAVTIPTTIVGEGGSAVIAPAVLIDAALADPEFAAWVAAGPVERWINPDIAHIGDTWQVGLFKMDPGGTEQYRGVVVDSAGHVISHRSG
jgi:hypothetical protein